MPSLHSSLDEKLHEFRNRDLCLDVERFVIHFIIPSGFMNSNLIMSRKNMFDRLNKKASTKIERSFILDTLKDASRITIITIKIDLLSDYKQKFLYALYKVKTKQVQVHVYSNKNEI